MGETVRLVEKHDGGTVMILESGKKIPADTVRLSAGRQGGTDELHLDLAGLSGDKRGRIDVNDHFQAEVDHIYAVGDVIGFPALAATAMEHGRRGSYHAIGEPVGSKLGELQLIGICTIPEISYIGATEEQLTDQNVPFEAGCPAIANWPAVQFSATPTGCSNYSYSPKRAHCWACLASAPTPPNWGTSGRR